MCLSINGNPGNLNLQILNNNNQPYTPPFALSPERGRFALTYSILEDKSFHFSLPVAKFALPDLGYKNGKYVSLFAPGVSFIIMPGYLIGKYFGLSQIGAFSIISLFAVFNIFLIYKILKELKIGTIPAVISSLMFVFATPAFTYAVNLYQHHISTFLILLSLYIMLKIHTARRLFFVSLLFAVSIPVDYPNLFLMFPIFVYTLFKTFTKATGNDKTKLSIKISAVLVLSGIIFPLVFFAWFNQKSYNDPWQFSGTVKTVREINSKALPVEKAKLSLQNAPGVLSKSIEGQSSITFFNSRNLLNGLYLHLFSPDRGVLFFTPVILLSLAGAYYLLKANNTTGIILISIAGINLILYSLWGDPWGGWAFGSRYLIPSYAISAIFAGFFLAKFSKKSFMLILFFALLSYSVYVNTSGALTTVAVPPQVEVLNLEKLSGVQERFSFDRNIHMLENGKLNSFFYKTFFNKYINSLSYFYYISGSIIFVFAVLFLILRLHKNKPYENK